MFICNETLQLNWNHIIIKWWLCRILLDIGPKTIIAKLHCYIYIFNYTQLEIWGLLTPKF